MATAAHLSDTPPPSERLLTPEIVALAAVVVLGTIMTILDATIVNVALATLGRDFETSISTVQWVATIYLLAFASVIPLTGWASERFGAKHVWLASLGVFMLGSLLSGLAWSIGSLIAFRALQGLGAGVILPVGAAAFLLAVRLLPAVEARRQERLDTLGLALLSGGIAAFAYGLAETGSRGRVLDTVPLTAIVIGLALVVLFV